MKMGSNRDLLLQMMWILGLLLITLVLADAQSSGSRSSGSRSGSRSSSFRSSRRSRSTSGSSGGSSGSFGIVLAVVALLAALAAVIWCCKYRYLAQRAKNLKTRMKQMHAVSNARPLPNFEEGQQIEFHGWFEGSGRVSANTGNNMSMTLQFYPESRGIFGNGRDEKLIISEAFQVRGEYDPLRHTIKFKKFYLRRSVYYDGYISYSDTGRLTISGQWELPGYDGDVGIFEFKSKQTIG